ncbi:IS5 family transposase, partial [Thermoactinomyces sp. CICC 10521]|nr:IS5 family transposase [Thermoactinomyces sp. CICC 10521]
LWKFGTGAPWRDLPERYGSWKTCYYRFTRWQKDGTWDRLLKYVQPTPMLFPISTGSSSSTAQLSELISTPQARPKKGDPHFQNEALGRSRGGLTTKIHLACDGKGRPLAFTITPGQQHDCTQLQALLDSICVPRFGKGRPRKRPDHLIADRGYSYPFCRRLLLKRGIPHTIPERKNQAERRSKKPGRPLSF